MKEIRDSLVKLGINGLNNRVLVEGKSLNYFFEVRDSFFHKLDCLVLTQNHLERLINQLNKYLENNVNALAPSKESINLMRALALETTYFLENYIFHLLSSMEHLKGIVALFYKDLNLSRSFRRTLYTQVLKDKQGKFNNKEILKFTSNKNYDWLITVSGKNGFYQYRADTYHNLSKLCDIKLSFNYNAKDNTSSTTSKIGVPKKLWDIRPDLKKDSLLDFMKSITNDYLEYLSDLIGVINKDNGF